MGRGLTPGGDDVVAGLLIGLLAGHRTDLAERISDRALQRVTERTTLLSADLLRLAADGQAEDGRGADRVAGRSSTQIRHGDRRRRGWRADGADRGVVAAWHTSGADLATGLAMGLRFAMSASDRENAMTAARLGAR